MAAENYQALNQILTKDFILDGQRIWLQCNPKRLVSSVANISVAAIQERPCFLCSTNRPAEQKGVEFEDFTILVNPFPVFQRHFTIANGHQPQTIRGHFGTFLRLAKEMDDCVVFYNGPKCGASAPDHLHFQAGSKGAMPLEMDLNLLAAKQRGIFDSGNEKVHALTPPQAAGNVRPEFTTWRTNHVATVYSGQGIELLELKGLLRGGWLLEGSDEKALIAVFDRLILVMTTGMEEPMMNVLGWYSKGVWQCLVFPRKAHRPSCYYREDEGKMLISPASVEMGGLVVAARLEDFERMTEGDLRTIFKEVSMSEVAVSAISEQFLESWGEPLLEVGIVSATEIPFTFPEPFRMVQTGKIVQGHCMVCLNNGKIEFRQATYSEDIEDPRSKQQGISDFGKKQSKCANPAKSCEEFTSGIQFENEQYDSLEFEAIKPESACFELPEVKIGIGFHWERTEKQVFEGRLKFLVEGDKLTAVNRVPLESYLTSVISSEMSAKASGELLKAHAVISRSWLMAQVRQKGKNTGKVSEMVETETERIKWYDREDHTLYDVCADDHCQRYQGITKASTVQVREAIRDTRGQTLVSEGEICDARFSKCCGGIMEFFENCWENEPKKYLQGLADCDVQTALKTTASVPNANAGLKIFASNSEASSIPNHALTPPQAAGNARSEFNAPSVRLVSGNQSISFPDLTDEANARAWILGTPPAFCNTTDKRILEQVLNNYDQETTDFFRWKLRYTTLEISQLAQKRSGIDFGEILDLIPVERGVSGRLIKLRVVGSKRTIILGKELEIRRTFSASHLYSSAFVIEKTADGFELIGAGWGHGVGLCQIGAAVMGEQGYDYQAILSHYYSNTELINQYL